eukprot:2406774-Pyramimonas_sp.AAC.1
MMVSSLIKVELHLCFRALWHRNREGSSIRASLKYPDAWIRFVLSTETEQLIIFCFFPCDGMVFLTKLELRMSSRALRPSNRKTIMRRAI